MKRIATWMVGLPLVLACGQAFADSEARQTRVAWLTSCPSDPSPVMAAQNNRSALLGALVAVVGPKLIEGAVDSAAEALKAAGQSKTFSSTAKSDADFYVVSQSADLMAAVNCLVVIRGVFDDAKQSPMQWARNSDELKGLQSTNFRLEAKLKPLRGLKYFQLVPQYLKVGEFEEDSFFDRKDRDYVVAASLTVPGGAQPFGSMEMTFKDIAPNTDLKAGDWRLRSATSLPIAFPAESADATKAKAKREAELAPYLLALDILAVPDPKPFGRVPDLYEDTEVHEKAKALCDSIKAVNQDLSRQHQLSDDRCSAYRLTKVRYELESELEKANRNSARQKWARGVCSDYKSEDPANNTPASCGNQPSAPGLVGRTFTYFTTQLTLSETREGSKFALYLGNALSSAKSDVSTALQAKLLPKTQATKDSEDEAVRTARTSMLVADLEVTKAEEDLADALLQEPVKPADITTARIALVKAKVAANGAHRKAGLPVPYPALD